MRIVCFLALLLILVNAPAQQESPDELIAGHLQENPMPGLAVTVAHKGKIVWSKGYGYSDLENRVPVHPAVSLFRIGSVAKPMTASALGRLYEQGKLDLDAEVQRYVPYFPMKSYPVTVRQVAGHLGGIRHYQGTENFSQKSYPNVRSGLSIFIDDELLHQPGSKYQYSSYGWNLLSAVVEGASGQDFLVYMQDSVFAPLAMLHTHADSPEQLLPGRGRYYYRTHGEFVPAPYVDNSYKWAGGGFLATSEDVARFAMQHIQYQYLNMSTFKEWTTSQATADGTKTNYGIGWRTARDQAGRHWVGHSGGSVGGTTMMLCYPEEELVIVAVTNMSGGQVGTLARRLAAWWFGH